MKTTNREELKNDLVQAVKDVGEMLINNAEGIVGDTDHVSTMTVTLRFNPENDRLDLDVSVEKEELHKSAYKRPIFRKKKRTAKTNKEKNGRFRVVF